MPTASSARRAAPQQGPFSRLYYDTFSREQWALARFNHERIAPGLGQSLSPAAQSYHRRMEVLEDRFVAQAREEVALLSRDVPSDPESFIRWFEQLKNTGPGQGDMLFPWLSQVASMAQMRWFLAQEVAGEAGFDDQVAMTQVKMPRQAKLEMARNYWDEMGRGDAKGMHGPMLEQLARYLGIATVLETTVPEALALANMMMALAINRRYAFHAVGALGVIEMTAPGRAVRVSQGLNRLGVPRKQSHYFALHAVLDVKHSEAWNREVLLPLVAEDPARAKAIGEGALLRLWCGARCFDSYRRYLMTPANTSDAAAS